MFNVGIAGAGYIGNKRAGVVSAAKGCRVTAVCDIDTARARSLAAQYGCRVVSDFKRLAEDRGVDIVIAATTNDKLAAVSIAALNNKKHVLCEKPLGRDAREAGQACNAARKNKRILKVGFNHRFHPAIKKALELSRAGAIGDIMYIRAVYGHGARAHYDKEWRMDPRISGGGELIDQGVHIIDLFRYFMGDFKEAFAINNRAFWKEARAEDNSFILLSTADKRTASAHVSITQWRNKFLFEVFGEKGYLISEGLGKSYGIERLVYGQRKKLGVKPVEAVYEFPGEDVSWALEWKEFIDAIKERREPIANGSDGLRANEIAGALYRSARTKTVVKI